MTVAIKHPLVDTRRTALIIIRAWTDEGSGGLRAHVVWQLDGDRSYREERGADGTAVITMMVADLLKRLETSRL